VPFITKDSSERIELIKELHKKFVSPVNSTRYNSGKKRFFKRIYFYFSLIRDKILF